MLWESADARQQQLPPHRATDLIGYPPTERVQFEVEATIEGEYSVAALSGLGLVYSS